MPHLFYAKTTEKPCDGKVLKLIGYHGYYYVQVTADQGHYSRAAFIGNTGLIDAKMNG